MTHQNPNPQVDPDRKPQGLNRRKRKANRQYGIEYRRTPRTPLWGVYKDADRWFKWGRGYATADVRDQVLEKNIRSYDFYDWRAVDPQDTALDSSATPTN
jgi:hypothetical protein